MNVDTQRVLDPETPEGAAALDRARSAHLLVGVIVPVLLGSVAVLLMLLWLPDLPDPAAVHWSGAGADGAGPAWSLPAIAAGVCIGLPLLFWLTSLTAAGSWGATMRFMGALALGLTVFLSIGLGASVWGQRGITTWHDAPDIGLPMLAGAGIGLVAGVAGWFLQPRVTVRALDSTPATALALPAGSRAVWTGSTSIAPLGMVCLGIVALLSYAGAFAAAILNGSFAWFMLISSVVVTVLVLATTLFRVRVDASGLTARGVLGWPRVHIPASDIASVHERTVSPMAEFGGWGLRVSADGATGIVLRKGPGIEVERRDGRRFVVTVPDAERAASVLALYANGSTPPKA